MNIKQLKWRIDALMQQIAKIKDRVNGDLAGKDFEEYMRLMDEVISLQTIQADAILKHTKEITQLRPNKPGAGPGICSRCKFRGKCPFPSQVKKWNRFAMCPRQPFKFNDTRLTGEVADFIPLIYLN